MSSPTTPMSEQMKLLEVEDVNTEESDLEPDIKSVRKPSNRDRPVPKDGDLTDSDCMYDSGEEVSEKRPVTPDIALPLHNTKVIITKDDQIITNPLLDQENPSIKDETQVHSEEETMEAEEDYVEEEKPVEDVELPIQADVGVVSISDHDKLRYFLKTDESSEESTSSSEEEKDESSEKLTLTQAMEELKAQPRLSIANIDILELNEDDNIINKPTESDCPSQTDPDLTDSEEVLGASSDFEDKGSELADHELPPAKRELKYIKQMGEEPEEIHIEEISEAEYMASIQQVVFLPTDTEDFEGNDDDVEEEKEIPDPDIVLTEGSFVQLKDTEKAISQRKKGVKQSQKLSDTDEEDITNEVKKRPKNRVKKTKSQSQDTDTEDVTGDK